jgi:cyanate permease
VAGAIGPVLMGWVFDATASYQTLLIVLAAGTLGAAALMQWMPRYPNQT